VRASPVISYARALQVRAIVHKGPVPHTGILPLRGFRGDVHHISILHLYRGPSFICWEEVVDNRGAHIGFYKNPRLVPRERPDCLRRVISDARESAERAILARYTAVFTVREPRGIVQKFRAAVVSESAPLLKDLGERRGCERAERRKGFQERTVLRHDPLDLRLLEHHLRNQNTVRIARLPPRERVPPSLFVVGVHQAAERGDLHSRVGK
jgi:hypothetical protein